MMRSIRSVTLVVLTLAVMLAGACAADGGSVTADQPLLVAAAADLMPAFTELGADFEDATGEQVTFVFGSSGQLAQQILEGAPMDLYAAADVSFVEQVLEAGIGDASTQTTYAFGRITIWSREDGWGGWDDLAALVADDAVGTVAIANPEHAPYGTAAKQAFESTGLWETVEPRLVFGENIADTQRLAATGNADAAVVALSLAIAADETDGVDSGDDGGDDGGADRGDVGGDGGRWVLIDEQVHEPLQQDLIVTTADADRAALAARFGEHVTSERGREVMRRYGLLLPGEQLVSPAATVGS